MACITCPFAFTDESEQVQNYGCLPTPYEIIEMKRKSGHNWACHGNEKKKCTGFQEYVAYIQEQEHVQGYEDNLKDIDTSTGGLISYDVWCKEGEEAALAAAKREEE